MPVFSYSRRYEGGRIVVRARGTLTSLQVAQLAPRRQPPENADLELHLDGVQFDVGAMEALARLIAEERRPIQVFPAPVRAALQQLASSQLEGVGLCMVDPDGRVRFANAEARLLLRLERGEAEPLWSEVAPGGAEAVAEAVASGVPTRGRAADDLLLSAVPMSGGGCIVCIVRGTPGEGEGRGQDARLEMAVAAAHEIRNPLAAIRAGMQLLDERLAGSPHARTIGIVLGEIDRLGRLLDHYLTLNRPTVRHEVDLASVIQNSLLLVRQDPRSEGVEVEFKPPSTPVRVLVDPEKLRQVFWNLLANALDALAGQGAVTIGLHVERKRRSVTVTVRDSGPGLPPEMLAAPFEAFRTTKPGGTGLGLTISHELVTAMGGRLELKNAKSGGAEVAVTLPLNQPAVTEPGISG